VDAPALAAEGETQRAGDAQSPAPLAYGRLLTVETAARYLGVSGWTVQQYIVDGTLPTVELPRPKTASAFRKGARRPIGDVLRRVLLDRADLDQFVDGCRRVRR
jgi:hypothetical protein